MARVAHVISEQDLHAYVDDCLPPARRRAVETYLAGHDEARAMVETYRDQNKALRALPDAAGPLPDAMRHLCTDIANRITRFSPAQWNKPPLKRVSLSPRR